jgi:prolyl-tRNA editing enzyme YbaK/EbsC (Cys-tRNA(Pro) deacylase)
MSETLARGILVPLTVASPDARVIAALERLGCRYEIVPCDPELADTAAFCAAYGIPLGQSANAILVSSRRPPGERAVCLVLATTRLDVNGVVRRRLDVKKVSFASAEETTEVTGMEIGGVTPFGLPEGLRVWVDSRVMEPEWVIVGAGSRSAKIKIDPSVLLEVPVLTVVSSLASTPQEEGVADRSD